MPDSQSTVPDTAFGLPLSRAVQEPVIGNRAPGASGTGDMIGANNLSDVASAATALANIGGASTASVVAAQAAAEATAAADATTKANAAQSAAIAAATALVDDLSGVSNAATARTNLGLVIGTNVQAFDADLSTIAAANNGTVLAATTEAFLIADGTKLDGIEALADVTDATNVNAAGAVMESDYNANTILAATADNTPLPLTVGASTFLGRKATGDISAMSVAEAKALLAVQETIIIAVSDETTAITTGTAKVTFRMPFAMTLNAGNAGVRASLNTVSSSGIPTVDINEGGATILSTKLTIDASEKTSLTAATAAVISDTSLADDAEITIDIDVAGTGAKGLKVILMGVRT
jgi:hypothetical protein